MAEVIDKTIHRKPKVVGKSTTDLREDELEQSPFASL